MTTPLFNRVLLRRQMTPTASAAGLYIPPQPSRQATVVAVAAGITDIAPGDTVVTPLYNGTEVTVAGETLEIHHISEIPAVFRK